MPGSTEEFERQRGRLTHRQRDAIRTWQRTDRSYELVQAILRGAIDPATLPLPEQARIEALIADLDDAIECGRTTRALTVYRGIRSIQRTFGTDSVPEWPSPLRGFTAVSIHRKVADAEFTVGGGALLEIELPIGTPALWVAGTGDERFRYQGEILLQDRLKLHVTDVRHDGNRVVICAVVISR